MHRQNPDLLRYEPLCRGFLPPRQTLKGSLRHPQVLCIITQHLWMTVYFKAGLLDTSTSVSPSHHYLLSRRSCTP